MPKTIEQKRNVRINIKEIYRKLSDNEKNMILEEFSPKFDDDFVRYFKQNL